MTDSSPELSPVPEANVVPARRFQPQIVWLVPLAALLIGSWLLVNTLGQRGPIVTISFLTAEGIEPGKTRIRYKDVEIGEVREVSLAPDRSHVRVTAQLVKDAKAYLAEDTRFWVVRPRVSGGKVSGIGTLLSGAYIGADVGKAENKSKEFVGLEVAPILTLGLPGRHFTLEADDIGSLDIGSPVYFRRIQVGEVVAHELSKDGGTVTATVFIRAPYDTHVKPRTRFWNASGVDLSMDASGVRLQTQSLVSIAIGGIAFETPDLHATVGKIFADWNAGKSDPLAEEAPADANFVLHSNRAAAMKAPDGDPIELTVNFKHSIRGLVAGAPVDFRGIVVGEVLSVGAEYDEKRDYFDFPVRIALFTERITLRGPDARRNAATRVKQGLLKAVEERGLRAQLRSGNLFTGLLYVALDFFPEAPKVKVKWTAAGGEFPAVPGDFQEMQASLSRLLAKLEKLPLEQIGGEVQTVLKSLDQSLKSVDSLARRIDKDVAPEITAGMKELRTTLMTAERLLAADSPMQQDVRDALREVVRAAQSVRTLSDTLERQPEALLRGKSEAAP